MSVIAPAAPSAQTLTENPQNAAFSTGEKSTERDMTGETPQSAASSTTGECKDEQPLWKKCQRILDILAPYREKMQKHAGMVGKGCQNFNALRSKYSDVPQIRHLTLGDSNPNHPYMRLPPVPGQPHDGSTLYSHLLVESGLCRELGLGFGLSFFNDESTFRLCVPNGSPMFDAMIEVGYFEPKEPSEVFVKWIEMDKKRRLVSMDSGAGFQALVS